jgi:hypothetical protein
MPFFSDTPRKRQLRLKYSTFIAIEDNLKGVILNYSSEIGKSDILDD